MSFVKAEISEFNFAPVKEIGENWGILTGCSGEGFNSMTVSWGAAGVLWNRPCVFVFVRPGRYTYKFMEDGEYFSLSLMPENYHAKMSVFGSKSGRDCDKYAESGFHTGFSHGTAYCAEAQTVFICKKTAAGDIAPSWFCDSSIDSACYPKKDYHRMYVGEIVEILKNTNE